MLKNARLFEEDLREKMLETWYDLKYQYYYAGNSYFYNEIKLDNESCWTFVSVDDYDEVIGAISFQIANDSCCVRNFGMMSFYDGLNLEFARDVASLIDDIFCKYHFNRMEWYCVDGNPVLKTYKKFCERHGGTIMAHEHECIKTIDGKLRDAYGFEILAKNYIPVEKGGVQGSNGR